MEPDMSQLETQQPSSLSNEPSPAPPASPAPSKPSPTTPDDGTHDDPVMKKLSLKRLIKVAVIIVLYYTVKGIDDGIHQAFTTLAGQNFLHLSAFWQVIVTYTANGNADGVFQAFRVLLVAWAGPDVINIVGPIIGSAFKRTANAVRVMSRAVRGLDDPLDTSTKK
jgi:hypothetical protein